MAKVGAADVVAVGKAGGEDVVSVAKAGGADVKHAAVATRTLPFLGPCRPTRGNCQKEINLCHTNFTFRRTILVAIRSLENASLSVKLRACARIRITFW